jgi:hypothetical protein
MPISHNPASLKRSWIMLQNQLADAELLAAAKGAAVSICIHGLLLCSGIDNS